MADPSEVDTQPPTGEGGGGGPRRRKLKRLSEATSSTTTAPAAAQTRTSGRRKGTLVRTYHHYQRLTPLHYIANRYIIGLDYWMSFNECCWLSLFDVK
jgi:hypothetical protein